MRYTYYVYILTTRFNKMFYIGVTGNLESRMYQHKTKQLSGYTKKYNVTKLVYYEEFEYVYDAIAREKQLKRWHRQWKINLIRENNPEFNDLSEDWN